MPWFDQDEGGEQQSAGAEWTDAMFGTIYDVLRSLEFAISGVEGFINSAEFLQEWNEGNYFQSGYFFGSGIFNTLFLWYDLFSVYVDNLMYQ